MTSTKAAPSGTLRVSVEDDFVLDAGSWLQSVDEDHRLVTRITPPGSPMFRQVIDHLEAMPRHTMTLLSWRNGPVEKVHAGQRFGHRFNERRVLPRDEQAIIRQAQDVLCVALHAVEHMARDGAWPPPPVRVLPFMRPFCHPRDWSYTEQSRVIELPVRTN